MSPLLSMLQQVNKNSDKKLRVLDKVVEMEVLAMRSRNKDMTFVGVEESEQGVSIAQSNFSNCHFIKSSIYDLPYQN
jgi:hypothetical protein